MAGLSSMPLCRSLGASGIQASVVGLGTWAASGGSVWGTQDESQAILAIQSALDEGLNLIDTAPFYGFGQGEVLVGKAIKGRRDRAVVVTKCGLWWQSPKRDFAFERDGQKIYRALDPETVFEEVDQSLTRLKTDVIDLYMTHWPERGEGATPIEETMDALMRLKKQGKIRAIGACNVTLDQARRYAEVGQLDAIQNHYSLLDNSAFDEEFAQWADQQGIALLAWRPLEQGILSGRLKTGEDVSDYRSSAFWFLPQNRCRVEKLLAAWQDLYDRYDCGPAQLVLAYSLRQRGVSHVLVGVRQKKHVQDNIKASHLSLSSADQQRMKDDIAHWQQAT